MLLLRLCLSLNEEFEGGNVDAAAREREQPVGLQAVEGPADVEPAVVQLVGQPVHEDVQLFGSGRVAAVVGNEAHDALSQALGRSPPGSVQAALRLCGVDVEQVEAEDEQLRHHVHKVVLADGKEADVGVGIDGGSVALSESE